MTFASLLKNFDTLTKSRYAEIDNYPFMSSLIPIFTLLAAYILFVLKVGPAIMKNREPFELRRTLIAYNIFQVALSAYLLYRGIIFLSKTGPIYSRCYIEDPQYQEEIFYNTYLYGSAKASELLDTVFFVLRKKYKQTSFLHIYHHTLMMTATWFVLKYSPTDILTCVGSINSFVHMIMYTYYGLSAIGPGVRKYLKWKKYITKMQLVQFVALIFMFGTLSVISECPISRGFIVFCLSNLFLFIYLFSDFYQKTYLKKE